MSANERPVIAVTMGDASGIGPEIVAGALASEEINRLCRPVVVGSAPIMRDAIKLAGKPLKLRPVGDVAEATGQPGTMDILDLHNLERDQVTTGKICAPCGRAAMEYIIRAAQLATEGKVKAIVTAPINKEATKLAGFGDVGHLECLARLAGAREYATMLMAGPLRVVHLSTHHSLREACNLVTRERVLARLKLSQESFTGWGIKRPRLAVAALNPHGGENGLFGREEIEEIGPAVAAARQAGIDARGPFPADSVFNRALNGEFDAVLALYHDQGHIPVKVYNFARSVSVALGLPYVRTSVDHGTAFDIAGKGVANAVSLAEAVKVAVGLSSGQGLPDK